MVQGNNNSSSFDERVLQVIPSVVNMISSSADHQQSEEAYNTGAFELPNPNGKAGGACTSAFLQQQYESGKPAQSWVETLLAMRTVLKSMNFDQIPTLTSSRIIDASSKGGGTTAPMQIVPPNSGRRRALLIGINYVGQQGQLTACHSDCKNVLEYLLNVHGFREEECLVCFLFFCYCSNCNVDVCVKSKVLAHVYYSLVPPYPIP